MKMKSVTYVMTDEEVMAHPFIAPNDGTPGFYKYFAQQLGYDWEHVTSVDCTKICVAPNIQEAWYEAAKQQGIDTTDFTMCLAIQGPKCPNKESSGYELGHGEVTMESDAIKADLPPSPSGSESE